MKRLLLLYSLLMSLFCGPIHAEVKKPVYIGFDGEYGLLNSTSAQSIELGIRLAIDEINTSGGVLGGRPLELQTRDNRSVPARGVANLKLFSKQQDLVAVFGGRFSPVILQSLKTVHELKIPLLDAWGSATGITEHDYTPSYTFRLSLSDRLGMPVMIEHALSKGGKKLGLMLPNTGWGRSNHKEALRYTEEHSMQPLPAVWYNWGDEDIYQYYDKLRLQGVDSIILVANDNEGSKLLRAMANSRSDERLPIISHWGVTGGRLLEKSGPSMFDLDFSVIQTFSFFSAEGEVAERVLATLKNRYGLSGPAEIPAPVGLAHAYDLTHILALAIDIAGTTDRERIRDALEQVKDYQGLTGSYPQPFTAERHDAMRREQLFMARYRRDGAIVPLGLE